MYPELPEVLPTVGWLLWDLRAYLIPALGFALFAALVRILRTATKPKAPSGAGGSVGSIRPPRTSSKGGAK